MKREKERERERKKEREKERKRERKRERKIERKREKDREKEREKDSFGILNTCYLLSKIKREIIEREKEREGAVILPLLFAIAFKSE